LTLKFSNGTTEDVDAVARDISTYAG